MADVTNDFGVCVLQIIASPNENTVFSPYGLMSMALLVYEGTTGQSAAEIYNTLHLPWHRDIVRIGFRDLHRYLRSYFSSEGFLKGLVLSKPNITLLPSYIEVLKFYGFQPETSITKPLRTTQASLSNETVTTYASVTTIISETTSQITEILTETTSQESTKLPETTTKPQTILTTATETMTTQTTILDTEVPPMETADEITTVANKQQSLPEVLSMQVPTSGDKTEYFTTTEFSTKASTKVTQMTSLVTETMKTYNELEGSTIEPVELQKTTLEMTSETRPESPQENEIGNEEIDTQFGNNSTVNEEQNTATTITTTGTINNQETKLPSLSTKTEPTTAEINTVTITDELNSVIETVTMILNKTEKDHRMTTNQETTMSSVETEIEPTTTEMNILTLINEFRPELESMNMILNKTDENQGMSEIGTTLTTNFADHVTDNTSKQVNLKVTKFVGNEVSTKKIYVEHPITETITFIPIPIEDIVILTTPPDAEDVTNDKSSSMLEAFILLEKEKDLQDNEHPSFTTYYSVTKRSTENPTLVTNPAISEYYTMPLNSLYLNTNKPNETQSATQFEPDFQPESLFENKDQFSSIIPSSNAINSSESILLRNTELPTQDIYSNYEKNTSIEGTTSSEEIKTGFSTLEPETIIFHSLLQRLSRSIKNDEKPSQLGNWVGAASGWQPNPTEQWFWTYSGDKLVPVLTYTAYLPYTELPSLHAAAVQLPLDDVRYTLMILLPKNSRGLKQMLYSLQWNPLQNIIKSFNPTPVYAVVPTFTIVKHINLTPTLHKLGIRSIFDAYLANLSELSTEPNLYVRSIEQVITISVHKYFTTHKWIDTSPSQVEQHFLATHPFAYFVIDIETKVALIAGTIVDPLLRNS